MFCNPVFHFRLTSLKGKFHSFELNSQTKIQLTKMLLNFRPLHTRWLQSPSLPLMNGNHSELNNTKPTLDMTTAWEILWQKNAYSVRFLAEQSTLAIFIIHQFHFHSSARNKFANFLFTNFNITFSLWHNYNHTSLYEWNHDIWCLRVKISIAIYEICGCSRNVNKTFRNKWKIKCTDWKKRQISNNNLKCERFAIVPFHCWIH